MEQSGPVAQEKVPRVVSEDRILDQLHRCTDGDATCTEEDASMMHADFEKCEAGALYKAYAERQIPTLVHLETAIAEAIESIPEELKNDESAKKLTLLLQGRGRLIRGFVRSYVQTVIKFVRLSKTTASMRDPEIFVKIDHERRRRHEVLLKSLSDLSAMLREAEDIGLIDKGAYTEWSPADTNTMPQSKIPAFSAAAVANRDLIRDWALAADFAEQFEKLHEILSAK